MKFMMHGSIHDSWSYSYWGWRWSGCKCDEYYNSIEGIGIGYLYLNQQWLISKKNANKQGPGKDDATVNVDSQRPAIKLD